MGPVAIKVDKRRGQKEVLLSEPELGRQTALAVRICQPLHWRSFQSIKSILH